ncbi:hypothetical protein AZ78_3874 [Lysobacter capsici AZ78]|uniref:Uncharacterized protein n=1 Tax=Lysobacter capsici AZ78 TaxID=1444315 RepID=A0A108UC73_9GAMM|nr:hypothetical protein AZ78_3874 [Lysobacter capsici AZ78]
MKSGAGLLRSIFGHVGEANQSRLIMMARLAVGRCRLDR